MVYLNHLLNEEGDFYKYSEFKAIYNLDVPFTVFYGIIDAIPGGWKNKIKRQDQISNVKSTCNVTLATRSIYSTIF